MSSTELAPVDPIQALTEKPWIDQIDERQLALIQNTVARGLNKAEVGQFLEIARGLGMNPWANEIWAAKGKGKDGGEGKLLLMVGRDGLIAHAERRFDDYMGYEAGVVYAGDTFERVDPDPSAASMRGRAGVVHRQAKPHDGDLLGAWAVAERHGRPPRFFYAALSEYMPKSDGQVRYSPWGSAVAIMIEKVPISIVHRTLCGLGSQVYLEEEVARALSGPPELAPFQDRDALLDAIIDNIPLEQQERAKDLIDEQNSLAPHSWTAAKVELVFRGKSAYATSVELSAIEKAIEELRARSVSQGIAEGHVRQGGVLAPLQVGDEVEDAEVVEPGETRSFGWECPHCGRGLLSESEACGGKFAEKDHPASVAAVAVVVPATPDELETAERIRAERAEELERVLAEDGALTEQQRSDVEAELDALTTGPPVEDVDGQAPQGL